VELFREQARIAEGRHLAVFDGGYALGSVVRPLISPEDDSPRIEFLTRLRHNARLYALPPKERPKLIFYSSLPVFDVSPFAMGRDWLPGWNPGAT